MSIVILVQSLIILTASLYALVKGSDFFLQGATKLGRTLGMSSFVVGVLIVGMGTSLPELASSIAGVLHGKSSIVVANVVGSNITNILLIVGVMGFFGGRILIKQDLIKTELPLFVIATAHFVMVVRDGMVDRLESLLLLSTFGAYLWYTISESQNDTTEEREAFSWQSIFYILFGVTALIVGANYTIEMVMTIATGLSVPVGLLSITMVAIGTSLPELFVSIRAITMNETDMAIGNIFGSNVFNMLIVTGIPGIMFGTLPVDEVVMKVGLGIVVVASIMLFVAALARQVTRWEGLMMLIFFVFFLMKLSVFLG